MMVLRSCMSERSWNYWELELQVLSPGKGGRLQKLLNLCGRFNDIFALEGDSLSSNNFYKQNINLSDHVPVYIKNYRSPEIHQQEIDTQVDKLLNDNIIQASVSPYNSPILLVPKKSTTDTKKMSSTSSAGASRTNVSVIWWLCSATGLC